MLMQVEIESLGIGQYGAYLLIQRRVLRESLNCGNTQNQDREICKPQGTQAADRTHGGLLFDWIEYHPGPGTQRLALRSRHRSLFPAPARVPVPHKKRMPNYLLLFANC